jgi:hypothetical protein
MKRKSVKRSPAKALAAKAMRNADHDGRARTAAKKNVAFSYNRYKIFHGKQYTGMAVGRGHKWNYDPGVWTDKKVTPEKWTITYEVKKRRKGKAPEGSGAPVGTEYHWYILAHQFVKKLDANTYSTAMHGLKFKLAHKRFDKEKWNISEKTQQKHLVRILKEFIAELETESVEEFVASERPEPVLKKKSTSPARSRPEKKEALAEA